MTNIPQVNSELRSIAGGGFTEDYDQAGGADNLRWSGVSGAFVQEKIRSAFNASNQLVRVQETTLYVDGDLPLTSPIQAGDVVTYFFRNMLFTATVQTLESPRLPGTDSYTALALEDANAS